MWGLFSVEIKDFVLQPGPMVATNMGPIARPERRLIQILLKPSQPKARNNIATSLHICARWQTAWLPRQVQISSHRAAVAHTLLQQMIVLGTRACMPQTLAGQATH